MLIDIFSDAKQKYVTDTDLTENAEYIKLQLKGTYNRFNEVTDPLIIEALIYRMKELEMQYSFLIKKAKLERLSGEFTANGKFK